MIIKGGSRSNGAQLGCYLIKTGENARVKVLELPASARSVSEAVRNMERMGKATRGEKVLYHAQINPNPGKPMWKEIGFGRRTFSQRSSGWRASPASSSTT